MAAAKARLEALKAELQAVADDPQCQSALSKLEMRLLVGISTVALDGALRELARRPHVNPKSWRSVLGYEDSEAEHPARDFVLWAKQNKQTVEAVVIDTVQRLWGPEVAAAINPAKLARQVRKEAKREPPIEWYVTLPISGPAD